jgi:hypothetical protein
MFRQETPATATIPGRDNTWTHGAEYHDGPRVYISPEIHFQRSPECDLESAHVQEPIRESQEVTSGRSNGSCCICGDILAGSSVSKGIAVVVGALRE